MNLTDKINGDFRFVLKKFLFLEMRMLGRRTDRLVVLQLQFLQDWGHVAYRFQYRRICLKNRKMAIAKLLGNLFGIDLIAGLFLNEVNDVLPDLRIAVSQRRNLGSQIMIRDCVCQFIESLSVYMTD